MSDNPTDTPGKPGASAMKVGLSLGAIVLGAVVIFGLGVMDMSRSPSISITSFLKSIPFLGLKKYRVFNGRR